MRDAVQVQPEKFCQNFCSAAPVTPVVVPNPVFASPEPYHDDRVTRPPRTRASMPCLLRCSSNTSLLLQMTHRPFCRPVLQRLGQTCQLHCCTLGPSEI